MLNFILKCLWFMAPAGLANMFAFLSKYIRILKVPIDLGKSFRGKRILGDNKTWRGAFFGILVGFLVFLLQKYLYQFNFFHDLSLFDYPKMSWLFGLLLSSGAILGDLIKSFFKRRVNIAPGQSWMPFDQIDYTICAIVLGSFIFFPGWSIAAGVVAIGFLLHILLNLIGYLLKMKRSKL